MAVSFLEGQLVAGSSSVSRRLEIRIGNRVACEAVNVPGYAWHRCVWYCAQQMGVSVHA